VDGYSREREIQKLMQLRQLANGAPWIQVPEVDRKIIELMDAQWVSDLYKEPPAITQDQQEEQAIENGLLADGFMPQVKPNDDHLVHLQMCDGFIGFKAQQGTPIPPQQMGLFMQHMQMHVEAARQNAQYWKAHAQQIQPIMQKIQDTMKGLQKQQQAQQQAAAGMAALRGGGMGPPGPGGPGGAMTPMPPPGPMPPAPPVPGAPMAGPMVPQIPGGRGNGSGP
jgi:hypothetical protein